jgi:serine/threonine protein kinase
MGCGDSKASCLAVAQAEAPSQSPQRTALGQQDLEALATIPFTDYGPEQDFVIGKLLGKGSFGKVYHVVARNTDSEEIATSSSSEDGDGSRRRQDNAYALKVIEIGKGVKATSIVREWRVLEHLRHHPACVRYFKTYRTRDAVSFVFELMP